MQKGDRFYMEGLKHLIHYDPENPEPYLPALERVADDEVDFAASLSIREKVRAHAWTIATLMEHGLNVEITDEDKYAAEQILLNNEPANISSQKPAVILHLESLLTEYDHEIVHDAARVRRYVTNKLLEESSNTTNKPSERIKALELLGKISDVGMFVERSVVTIEHKSTEDLQKELENTLELLLNPETDMYEAMPEPNISIKDIPIGL
jgi:hypothetical protein